jgi:hypothetical protein
MIEKELVPHELSLRMKLIGFNEPCLAYYSKYNDDNRPPHLSINFKHSLKSNSDFRYLQTRPSGEGLFIGIDEGGCACPFITQAFRWFRENHNLIGLVSITSGTLTRQYWYFDIYDLFGNIIPDSQSDEDPYYKTYNETEIACLEELIKMVEEKLINSK